MQYRKILTDTRASLCMGGYIGWYLTVMYICEQSLYYYRDNTMLATVSVTFLLSSLIALAAIVGLLLLFDFEGLLRDKLMRWLPGLFMAESGVALSLANANTMTLFSAIAGAAAAFGALAVMTQLLTVKVGSRMAAIGAALAIGGGMRILATWILSSTGQRYFIWLAASVGVVAVLCVHTNGSGEGGPLVSLAEAEPSVIIRRIPRSYILLFFMCACFWLANGSLESTVSGMLPVRMESCRYEYAAYSGYIAAALAAALFITLPRLPMLCVCASGTAAAASFLALLPHFSAGEIQLYALLSFAALSAFRASVYLFIVVYSLDRPHPLFYSMLGVAVAQAGELTGTVLMNRADIPAKWLIALLLVLVPTGGAVIAYSMKRNSLDSAGLEHRHNISAQIRRTAAALELSERERMMVENVVLNGYGVDELASKLLFSRNTVRVLLRPILEKTGVKDIAEMRDYFNVLTAKEESFHEKVQEAVVKRRYEQRAENVNEFLQAWREHLYKRDAEKEQRAKEKAARLAEKSADTAAPEDSEADSDTPAKPDDTGDSMLE